MIIIIRTLVLFINYGDFIMNREQSIHFIKDLFSEVWDSLDEAKVVKYYHKDVVAQFGQQTAYYKDIEHRLQYVKKHFGTLKSDIKEILVDGDKVTVRLEQQLGKSDKKFEIITIYQIRDEKISAMWACIDPQINYFE